MPVKKPPVGGVNRNPRDDAIDTADPVMHAPKSAQPHSRLGKKPVTAYVEKAAHKQLRSLGLDLEKSTQDMVIDALNDYFERHGLERLA